MKGIDEPLRHRPLASDATPRAPLPLSDLDLALTAQLAVAWAGVGGEEPRLGWQRTDLVSELGGIDPFRRPMPATWERAVFQAVREAAPRADAGERETPDQADRRTALSRTRGRLRPAESRNQDHGPRRRAQDGAGAAGRRIDIAFVVGTLSLGEVIYALGDVQTRLNPEVNCVVQTRDEFQARDARAHHFVSGILLRQELFLIGDDRELERLATQRMVDAPQTSPREIADLLANSDRDLHYSQVDDLSPADAPRVEG